jgi:hypothetical protein
MIKFYCDESYKKRIKEIKEYAEKNPYNFLNGIPADVTPAEENKNLCIYLGDVLVVYSIQLHPEPEGKLHHLSISLFNQHLPPTSIAKKIVEFFELGPLSSAFAISTDDNHALNISIKEL